MGDLLLPVGPRRMSSWSAHQQRSPRSTEPGTDFYCPIGTPVLAPANGTIYGWGDSITPATGRWVGVDLDNGQRFRCMHLNRLVRTSGRVSRGEVIGISGASGYGKPDWSSDPSTGGAHTHVTLWPTHMTRFGYDALNRPYTIDFMQYIDAGQVAGDGSTPFPIPEEDEVTDYAITHSGADAQGGVYFASAGHWHRLTPDELAALFNPNSGISYKELDTGGNLAILHRLHDTYAPPTIDLNGAPIPVSLVDVDEAEIARLIVEAGVGESVIDALRKALEA